MTRNTKILFASKMSVALRNLHSALKITNNINIKPINSKPTNFSKSLLTIDKCEVS